MNLITVRIPGKIHPMERAFDCISIYGPYFQVIDKKRPYFRENPVQEIVFIKGL